jgi:hypothetical protein
MYRQAGMSKRGRCRERRGEQYSERYRGVSYPVSKNWRTAIRLTGEIGKGSASFQAPGGEPLLLSGKSMTLRAGFGTTSTNTPSSAAGGRSSSMNSLSPIR